MEYDPTFIDSCKDLFKKIKQNRPLKECLNTASLAVSTDNAIEVIWFVYYMFFSIHNPKMEEYIQKKTSTSFADIIKNMIKRRHYTSTIVFQLYTHAYTNNGNVTCVYPKYKSITERLIKSYQSNHLKTTAVGIRTACGPDAATTATATTATATTATATATAAVSGFIAYVITTAPTTPLLSTTTAVIKKINNHIHYKRKDIIILALICHMKIDEADINTKNIFIAATPEELLPTSPIDAAIEPEIPSTTNNNSYDEKYKYLYT
jgi:hypothetical protein